MEREFIEHCRFGNLEGVNDCLSRDVDVNTKEDFDGSGLMWTGLMFACEAGYSAIVSRLVQVVGLDINYQTEYGYTAAILASVEGKTKCVRILAETDRVDWNKADKRGRTPLYEALRRGRSDIVDIIVQKPNIDYNVKTKNGATLAQMAVEGGEWGCVETLASRETFDCWNVPNRDGDTPIMRALKRNRPEIVEVLLSCPRVDLNSRDEEGWSLVFRAIQSNKLGEKMLKC